MYVHTPNTFIIKSLIERSPASATGEYKLTGDKVHRDEDGSQRGKLGKHFVDLVVRVCHLDADLC